MEPVPDEPVPPPVIPKGKLWGILLLPPIATTVASAIIGGFFATKHSYGSEMLIVLPLGLIIILVGTARFAAMMRERYVGTSVSLTSIGYFLGQIIVCLALWFGACMIFLS